MSKYSIPNRPSSSTGQIIYDNPSCVEVISILKRFFWLELREVGAFYFNFNTDRVTKLRIVWKTADLIYMSYLCGGRVRYVKLTCEYENDTDQETYRVQVYEGTGLELVLTKKIVKLRVGKVDIPSITQFISDCMSIAFKSEANQFRYSQSIGKENPTHRVIKQPEAIVRNLVPPLGLPSIDVKKITTNIELLGAFLVLSPYDVTPLNELVPSLGVVLLDNETLRITCQINQKGTRVLRIVRSAIRMGNRITYRAYLDQNSGPKFIDKHTFTESDTYPSVVDFIIGVMRSEIKDKPTLTQTVTTTTHLSLQECSLRVRLRCPACGTIPRFDGRCKCSD